MIYYVHLILFTGILTAISVIIFGAKSVTDDQWKESPEKNFVSWSFGCVVFSGFLILFAGVSLIVAALQAKLVNDYDSRHDYDRRHDYDSRHDYDRRHEYDRQHDYDRRPAYATRHESRH
jgi:ABC-type nickel/cobalt efflux system permease component RcnA